jgi:hypothetical protein
LSLKYNKDESIKKDLSLNYSRKVKKIKQNKNKTKNKKKK